MPTRERLTLQELIPLYQDRGVFWRGQLDVVTVSGPDADSFLQGQVTQDLAALAPGATVWSMLLAPKGHLVSWHRVVRTEAEGFSLVMQEGLGESAAKRLDRFKLRVDCQVGWTNSEVTFLRGSVQQLGRDLEAAERYDFEWDGFSGCDLANGATIVSSGLGEISQEEAELLRIWFGIPAWGSELSGETLPAATGLVEESVNFDKGCFVGQELVVRMLSRSTAAPTQVARFDLSGDPGSGRELVNEEGNPAGFLTSVVGEAPYPALGLVKRSSSELSEFGVSGTTVRAVLHSTAGGR